MSTVGPWGCRHEVISLRSHPALQNGSMARMLSCITGRTSVVMWMEMDTACENSMRYITLWVERKMTTQWVNVFKVYQNWNISVPFSFNALHLSTSLSLHDSDVWYKGMSLVFKKMVFSGDICSIRDVRLEGRSKYHGSHLAVTGSALSPQSTTKGEMAAQNTISISSSRPLYMQECQFA